MRTVGGEAPGQRDQRVTSEIGALLQGQDYPPVDDLLPLLGAVHLRDVAIFKGEGGEFVDLPGSWSCAGENATPEEALRILSDDQQAKVQGAVFAEAMRGGLERIMLMSMPLPVHSKRISVRPPS